jgi:hypothetical protein
VTCVRTDHPQQHNQNKILFVMIRVYACFVGKNGQDPKLGHLACNTGSFSNGF